jgi:hypothetical protein
VFSFVHQAVAPRKLTSIETAMLKIGRVCRKFNHHLDAPIVVWLNVPTLPGTATGCAPHPCGRAWRHAASNSKENLPWRRGGP